MKGPFLRLRYAVDRVWECQTCHQKVRTSGTTTTHGCDCRKRETGKSISMRLIADGLRRMPLPIDRAPSADGEGGQAKSRHEG